MSQVVKRVCDLCGHEITENLDTGNINFNYANSMGYMCSHNIDICKECAPKIVPALHKTLTDLFKLKENDNEVSDLNTFFQRESIMQEEMKKYQEEMDKANNPGVNTTPNGDTNVEESTDKEEEASV